MDTVTSKAAQEIHDLIVAGAKSDPKVAAAKAEIDKDVAARCYYRFLSHKGRRLSGTDVGCCDDQCVDALRTLQEYANDHGWKFLMHPYDWEFA